MWILVSGACIIEDLNHSWSVFPKKISDMDECESCRCLVVHHAGQLLLPPSIIGSSAAEDPSIGSHVRQPSD